MSDDVRIRTSLPGHPKMKKLRRRLGGDGCWALMCLFMFAGSERWDGDLSGMSDEDIELAADWQGEMDLFVATLVDIGWLDGEAGERSIHNWHEHNPYAATRGQRIRKAKRAAAARWDKETGDATSTESDATSNAQNSTEHAKSSPKQCPPLPTTPTPRARSKAIAQRAARFDDFWAGYPVKKGKAKALKSWKAKGCDAFADQVIAHVERMKAHDDDWKRGYVPHGSTYVTSELWEDEPKAAPNARGSPRPSKTYTAIQNLEGMKRGRRLDQRRVGDGHPEASLLESRQDSGQ